MSSRDKIRVFRICMAAFVIITGVTAALPVQTRANVNIVGINGCSSSHLKHVCKAYRLLPANVRRCLSRDKWTVNVCGTNLARYLGYRSSILGMTYVGSNTIYVDCRCKADYSIIHEAGHAIDSTLDWPSSTSTFSNIWKSESKTFKREWDPAEANVSSCVEYFAESYYRCILNGSRMKKVCPKTYKYVMKYSKKM